MKFSEKKFISIILIIIVIVIIFILVAFGPAIFDQPTPGISLTKINESIVPRGTIYHLSDKDFEEFPTLAAVIRDNAQRGVVFANGTRIGYVVKIPWEDKEKFNSKYPPPTTNYTTGESETFFEYEGKYYSYTPPMIP